MLLALATTQCAHLTVYRCDNIIPTQLLTEAFQKYHTPHG